MRENEKKSENEKKKKIKVADEMAYDVAVQWQKYFSSAKDE